MIGSLINGAAILLAGLAAWGRLPAISGRAQRRLQVLLGGLTLGLGFHVLWLGIGGTPGQVARQIAVLLLALVLGRLTGQWMGVQALFNRLGQFAGHRLTDQHGEGVFPTGEIFTAATVVFCLTPLAIVGPLQEGLRGDARALLVKAAVDALATLALVRTRGWEVAIVAVPVVAVQGTLTLVFSGLRDRLDLLYVGDVLYASSGFLLVAAAMVMLQVLRVRLADYLPTLLWAPLLGWLAF